MEPLDLPHDNNCASDVAAICVGCLAVPAPPPNWQPHSRTGGCLRCPRHRLVPFRRAQSTSTYFPGGDCTDFGGHGACTTVQCMRRVTFGCRAHCCTILLWLRLRATTRMKTSTKMCWLFETRDHYQGTTAHTHQSGSTYATIIRTRAHATAAPMTMPASSPTETVSPIEDDAGPLEVKFVNTIGPRVVVDVASTCGAAFDVDATSPPAASTVMVVAVVLMDCDEVADDSVVVDDPRKPVSVVVVSQLQDPSASIVESDTSTASQASKESRNVDWLKIFTQHTRTDFGTLSIFHVQPLSPIVSLSLHSLMA
eukprot:m.1168431 g.1168431  ORF g.1168431 m.1168431 type:complete len:311 (-) comp24508_c0_seq54:729-1661(-)